MFEAANFPHIGEVLNPQPDHYRQEARALRINGRAGSAERFEEVLRRLTWTPKYLAQMKQEDAA